MHWQPNACVHKVSCISGRTTGGRAKTTSRFFAPQLNINNVVCLLTHLQIFIDRHS